MRRAYGIQLPIFLKTSPLAAHDNGRHKLPPYDGGDTAGDVSECDGGHSLNQTILLYSRLLDSK